MNRFDEIIEKMNYVIENPKSVIEQCKKENKKVVGVFPVYCPEELIYAGGMFPIGIWGGEVELNRSKEYFPAFACSIMQSCLELALNGAYNELSAVIIPGMCDTLICMGQNFKEAVKEVPYIALVHPQNRKLESGIKYLRSEYLNVKENLEKISGNKIEEEDILKSIDIYNEHRKTMREFVDVAAKYPSIITPIIRNTVIKSAFFIDKKEHTSLTKDLMNEVMKNREDDFKGKRVILSGISVDSKAILKILEENNIAVVGDDLAQETRQFRSDIPKKGTDSLEMLARWWSEFEGCSLAYDPKKLRGNMIVDTAKKYDADGVIFCMMKFCDPEEYDYPYMKKAVDEAGIRNLYIEVDQQMENLEQIRTRIQTFAEILDV